MRHRDLAAHPITFAIVLLATLLCGADSLADGRMDRHEGVATCASSTCHAATQALGGHGIRQDEYFTWQQRDAHAGAYRTLLGERSRRMGAKLGIDPASDRACLSCHSDAVPALARGERFLVEDGIGCEACHGGSERWLAAHTEPGIAREEKLRLGMTATWQPAVRAKLCLQCHQGDAAHPITHGMMAAGHPPLLFELDTFSALQPPHHEQDADYTARKGERDAAREWAVGQATAALLRLDALADSGLMRGVFPELVHFDCAACHRSMGAGRWLAARNARLSAGTPPLGDTALHWVATWLEVGAPSLAPEWARHWQALRKAQLESPAALAAAAARMRGFLHGSVLPVMVRDRLDAAGLRRLLGQVAALADGGRAHDFATAQQAAMAALVFRDTLAARGSNAPPGLRAAVDRLYAAVEDVDRFDPARYREALAAMSVALAQKSR